MEKPTHQCKNVVASSHSAQNFSRHDLLQWINSTLSLKVKNVESLCSGAAYCQFMNFMFPGCLNIKKIKLDATIEYEFISNLKQLQIAFRRVGCDKDVPIEKLIKGRFQENFEFVQWFKKFVDANIDTSFSQFRISEVKHPDVVPKKNVSRVIASTPRPVDSACSDLTKKPVEKIKHLISEMAELDEKAVKIYKERDVSFSKLIAAMEEKADVINKERDFYFNKLRNIEVLCSDTSPELDKEALTAKILAELYATGENVEASGDKTN